MSEGSAKTGGEGSTDNERCSVLMLEGMGSVVCRYDLGYDPMISNFLRSCTGNFDTVDLWFTLASREMHRTPRVSAYHSLE